YSWWSLTWAGRYVHIRTMLCRDCGTLFNVHRLTCPMTAGCVVGVAAGVATAIGVSTWQQSVCLGCSVAYGATLACWALMYAVGWSYTRIRFRERAQMIDGPRSCPKCGSVDFVRGGDCRDFPCPQCGDRSLQIHIEAM